MQTARKDKAIAPLFLLSIENIEKLLFINLFRTSF